VLGERIGVGRTAEVFAWRDDAIIKVLRPGFPDRLAEREAAVAERVTSAGLAAPRFLGIERVEGRIGLVYERVGGPSMLDRLTGRPWLIDDLARRFATLHAAMHEAPGTGLPEQIAALGTAIERSTDILGTARRDAALVRLRDLTPGGVVCHGDMHPGNVIMATTGPVVIDWLTAGAGAAEADVARTLFLLVDSDVPGVYPRLQRAIIDAVRRRFADRYVREYRRRRALDEDQLRRWRLPTLAARLGDGIEEERSSLLAAIDADLAMATP